VKSPEKQGQYIDILRTETKRLSNLVERILEFARVDGRGRSYQLEPVDLVPLVRETVGAFAQKPAAQGFRIAVKDDGGSPVVLADPAALEQALVNLLDNAVKYSENARDVAVRVSSAEREAIVAVEDHGSGIPAAEQARVFDRFYRGREVSQRSGFGLGLTIVREIVREHRGRIEIESAPGRGSLFRIRLPRRKSTR
jgi:two-component system phosphate regulon sensor histidine kinase PhoR